MSSFKREMENGKGNVVAGIDAGTETPRTFLGGPLLSVTDIPAILHNVCHPYTDKTPLQATR